MPTFTIIVREQTQRRDGTYPVSIRLTHNRKSVNISTGIYVHKNQVKKNFTGLKDAVLYRHINDDIIKYSEMLLREYGSDLSRFTAKDLANAIITRRSVPDNGNIDFVAFCREHIAYLRAIGREGSAISLEATVKNLTHYFERDKISIKEINIKNLQGFISYMAQPRKVEYVDSKGRKTKVNRKGCKPQTIKDYMIDLQTLFNLACDKYNDEDSETIIISHNPFRSKKLRIDVREQPIKRDLALEELVQIIGVKELPTARMQLARDVLVLSFYLLAMNTADLFGEDAIIEDGRVVYRRQKTKRRRKDEALFSVKIEPEAKELIKRYKDVDNVRLFDFYKRYSNFRTFNSNINKGCKQLAEHLGWSHNLSTYYIRHTWATIASEDCGLSDEEVALALNHIGAEEDIRRGKSLRVTRGYIHRRFSKNDTNHRKVLDLVATHLGG